MYQKDFVLRMIEMVRDLIMGILGLIKKGELEQASEGIERIYLDVLKQDSGFFQNIPAKMLTDKLLHDHNYTNGHLEILAELFNIEAELGFAKGKIKDSLELSEKSLILFEFIDNEQKIYSSERIEKMDSIRKRNLILLNSITRE